MDQQTAPAKTKIFFPNLDGLRFISFFVVFLYHCYMSFFSYLKQSDPDTFAVIKFLFGHGNLGVNFFFVLSGKLFIDLEDKTLTLQPGQGATISKGVIHRTRAEEKTVMLMVETSQIQPTGDESENR